MEEKLMHLIKEQYDKTGGANGLDLWGVKEKLGITVDELRELVHKLLKERKIIKLNHLNGTSYTLPK
ncbi:hypothetical protein [Chryseobacterium sp.]|uniref:hypothetical protein n=1 Tax=Chryseobacterium sp. TaxID=1871047 RepID=UPI00289B3FCD|nr:hypothetical protein [Chryseobacterium sp.]